jgi:hypothetical protein
METEEKVIQATEDSGEPDDLIRLSTGVILRGKMANVTTLLTVLAGYPRPKPPMWHNPTMGREMENFEDPDYISRVQAWRQEQGAALLNAFILLGTEVVAKPEQIPGHMPELKKVAKGKKEKGKPQEFEDVLVRDFLEEFELLGLPMKPQSAKWRYLKWVQTVACKTPEDTKLIQEVVGRLSGVAKSDVETAEEFPGSKEKSG